MRYSVQPRDITLVKGYGFLFFAKNMGKKISKNISKSLSDKYNQKLLDHAKQSATNALKTNSKNVIRKIVEATGDLIDNKTANKVTKISKTSQQNNSEIVTNKLNKEIPKKTYICDALHDLGSITVAFAWSFERIRMHANSFSTLMSFLSVCMS